MDEEEEEEAEEALTADVLASTLTSDVSSSFEGRDARSALTIAAPFVQIGIGAN